MKEAKSVIFEDKTASKHFSEVGKYKLPTPQQELDWFREYTELRRAEEVSIDPDSFQFFSNKRKKLGQQIATGYLRFVILRARKRTQNGELLKELIAQGYIGLMLSINKFDINRGFHFLTYAQNWIDVFMQEYLYKRSTVSIPCHIRKKINKIKKGLITDDKLKGHELEELQLCGIENIVIKSDENIEENTMRSNCNLFNMMNKANLTRLEKLIIIFSFGLRGTTLESNQIIQMFFNMDRSTIMPRTIRVITAVALQKLKKTLKEKGIEKLQDII